MRRFACTLLVVAGLLAGAAPAFAAEVAPAAAGASACTGSARVIWKPGTLPAVGYWGVHKLNMSCGAISGVARVRMECDTRLLFLNGVVSHGADSGSNSCSAQGNTEDTNYQALYGEPWVHRFAIRMTLVPTDPGHPVSWGASPSWCSGQGTAVAYCTMDRSVIAGTADTVPFG